MRIPLFPLQTVLFPDGVLTLRIFEVRYLDMITRCHEEDAPFGVVGLTQGREVRQPGDAGAESFHDKGTLARITHFERVQSGLLVVRCQGARRFELSGCEQLRHGLWVGQAHLLPDDAVVDVPPDLLHVKHALRQLVANLAQRTDGREKLLLAEPYRWDDCGWLANRWCELLPVSTELKQRCMTLDSPLLRLELVSDMLEKLRISEGRTAPRDGLPS